MVSRLAQTSPLVYTLRYNYRACFNTLTPHNGHNSCVICKAATACLCARCWPVRETRDSDKQDLWFLQIIKQDMTCNCGLFMIMSRQTRAIYEILQNVESRLGKQLIYTEPTHVD